MARPVQTPDVVVVARPGSALRNTLTAAVQVFLTRMLSVATVRSPAKLFIDIDSLSKATPVLLAVVPVAQTILAMYANGLALSQAAALPRVHHQYRPTQLDVEDSLDISHQEGLERLGFDVVQFPRLGILAAAQYDVNAKTLMALLDPRF